MGMVREKNKQMTGQETRKVYLRLVCDILVQIVDDFHLKPEELGEKTASAISYKSKQTHYKESAQDNVINLADPFRIYCNILELSPARTKQYILAMKTRRPKQGKSKK